MTNGNGSPTGRAPHRIARVKSNCLGRACRLLLLLMLSVSAGLAQGPAPTPILSPSPSSPSVPAAPPLPELTLPHELSKTDLEPFLDALIPAQLQNRDIA